MLTSGTLRVMLTRGGRPARTRDQLVEAPAPFIVGAGRSGTTMLRLMLDAHPQLAIPPETHFIPHVSELCAAAEAPATLALDAIVAADRWPSFALDPDTLRRRAVTSRCRSLADVLRLFYRTYAVGRGKTRWGDKTPWYVLRMPMIAELLEEAHFLHIIRDGRDVALSVIPLWFGPKSVPEAAAWWAQRVRAGRRDGAHLAYLEVRYEQLVERPETELRRLCAFIGLDFDAQMLSFDELVRRRAVTVAPHLADLSLAAALAAEPRGAESAPETLIGPDEMRARLTSRLSGPPDASSVGRWRTEMTGAEQRSFAEVAGDLLEELGYPLA